VTVLPFLLLAYLLGSIPTGKLVAKRLYDVDIQRRGSGNIGFANVRRTLGWRAGLLTLTGDIIKGFLPTLLCLLATGHVELAFLTGVVAIIGHVFPVWLKFKGGKGIATGLGILLAVAPVAAVAGGITYVIAGYVLKKSSYASVAGILMASAIGTILGPLAWWAYLILIIMAAWTLRDNLRGTVPDYDV
jgi:acyl phosphate:glycerol-3-phosphate acyltransferase